MSAYNVVRTRVKPGQENAFLEAHRHFDASFPGMHHFSLIKTGDRTYCMIGEWDDMDSIAAARPSMIAFLDQFRDTLEDLGDGHGVTDPVSGDVVVEYTTH